MPNFFTMKMREGADGSDDSRKVVDFVAHTNCVGIGDPDYTTGAGTFRNDVQIGDLIVLRAGGHPLALLKVISEVYQYEPEGKYPDFDNWLVYARNVKILSWYNDVHKEDPSFSFDARGYLQTCAAITGDKLPTIQAWYKKAMDHSCNPCE